MEYNVWNVWNINIENPIDLYPWSWDCQCGSNGLRRLKSRSPKDSWAKRKWSE